MTIGARSLYPVCKARYTVSKPRVMDLPEETAPGLGIDHIAEGGTVLDLAIENTETDLVIEIEKG